MSIQPDKITFPSSCVIWRVTDGKRGHERQTEGLVKALAALLPVQVVDVPCLPLGKALVCWLTRTFSPGAALPAPDMIMGAGHGTHLTMLAAQRAHGGKTVVLMKPSLPLQWFDLCLIPQHDGVAEAPGVVLTMGALNAVEPGTSAQRETGLMLVGGPSAHFVWNEASIVEQISAVLHREAASTWVVATSPRTPPTMLTCLMAQERKTVTVVPFGQVGAAWLPEQLAHAGQVWVTPDSVSMMYEALTSGAAVGVFELQKHMGSRVAAGLAELAQAQWVTSFSAWQQGKALAVSGQTFNEAARCARWIKTQWFPNN